MTKGMGPILLLGGAAAVYFLTKKKENGNGNGRMPKPDKNGRAPQAPKRIVIDFAGEAAIPERVPMAVGDTLELRLAIFPPGEWNLYTEVIQGNPVVVIDEIIMEPDETIEGDYGTYIATLTAHEPGQIKADIVLEGADRTVSYPTILDIT